MGKNPKPDDLYDFLYQDPRRIGSFLSQINSSGHLKAVSLADKAGGSSTFGASGGVEGKALFVASAKVAGSAQATEEEYSEISRSYDPIWSNAREFIKTITENGYLKNDISQSNIGDLTIETGRLSIINTKYGQEIYNSPAAEEFTRNKVDPITGEPFPELRIQIELNLAKNFQPHINGILQNYKNDVFFNLSEDYLTTTSTEIALKYGFLIDGEWSVIGIKDANKNEIIKSDQEQFESTESVLKGYDYGFIRDNLLILSGLRRLIGRPHFCYGLTPILIYRKVN